SRLALQRPLLRGLSIDDLSAGIPAVSAFCSRNAGLGVGIISGYAPLVEEFGKDKLESVVGGRTEVHRLINGEHLANLAETVLDGIVDLLIETADEQPVVASREHFIPQIKVVRLGMLQIVVARFRKVVAGKAGRYKLEESGARNALEIG